MNFDIDSNVWVNNMLPTFKRLPIIKAFARVITAPIFAYYRISGNFFDIKVNEIGPYLLTDFLQVQLRMKYPSIFFRKCWVLNQFELKPQTYLQFIGGHILQEFDFSIGEAYTQEFDYYIAEHKPLYDYIVVIPIYYSTPANLLAIETFLKKYKPAGRTFKVVFKNQI
jgi:hypothetical protein